MNGLLMIQVTVQLKSTPWLIFPHDLQVGEFWTRYWSLKFCCSKTWLSESERSQRGWRFLLKDARRWQGPSGGGWHQCFFPRFFQSLCQSHDFGWKSKKITKMLTLKSVRDNQCLKFMFQKWPKTPNTYPNPWLKSYPSTWGDVSFSLLASTYSSRLFTWDTLNQVTEDGGGNSVGKSHCSPILNYEKSSPKGPNSHE